MKKKYIITATILSFLVLFSGCSSDIKDKDNIEGESEIEVRDEEELTKEDVYKKHGIDIKHISSEDQMPLNWIYSMHGEPFIDFELQNEEGLYEKASSKMEENKPTVIYFFATWCSACESAAESVASFIKNNENDMNFIMVTGTEQTEDILAYKERWFEEKGEDFPAKIYSSNETSLDKYNIYGFPSLVFIDSEKNMYSIANTGFNPVLEGILNEIR